MFLRMIITAIGFGLFVPFTANSESPKENDPVTAEALVKHIAAAGFERDGFPVRQTITDGYTGKSTTTIWTLFKNNETGGKLRLGRKGTAFILRVQSRHSGELCRDTIVGGVSGH